MRRGRSGWCRGVIPSRVDGRRVWASGLKQLKMVSCCEAAGKTEHVECRGRDGERSARSYRSGEGKSMMRAGGP